MREGVLVEHRASPSHRGRWLALLLLWALALADLRRGGEPAGADALWTWLESEGAALGTDPRAIDAVRELSRVRPWQEGYADARQRRAAIETARLHSLKSDFVHPFAQRSH